MRHRNKYRNGFTLIEMIIAISIFSLTVLVATNIYVLVNNTQRKTLAAQKVMGDIRYIFEAMSQEVRLGKIDYAYYQDPNGDGNYADAIDLHPQAASHPTVLALTNQVNQKVFYRYSGTGIQYCELVAAGDCDLAIGPGWQNVTPAGVEVQNLEFAISPSADPFTERDPVSCSVGGNSDCQAAGELSYRCGAGSVCRYFSDGNNFQPKVLITMRSRAASATIAEQSRITMQTTVSTRQITGQAQNLNY